MGTVKRSSKLDDRLPHEWNLDFLTPGQISIYQGRG